MSRVVLERYPNHRFPQKMPIATLGNGAGITPADSVTSYTVLTGKNIRILKISVSQTNDELASKNLRGYVSIGGTLSAGSSAATASGAWSQLSFSATSDTVIKNNGFNSGGYVALGGKYVSVLVRHFEALGTNSKLFASVQYEQLSEVANP